MLNNISDINIEFGEAMEMIFMVEELLEGNASELLSPKAFKGMSTTLKVARNILRNSEHNAGFNRVANAENLSPNLENYELPKLNKLGSEDLNPDRVKSRKRISNKKTFDTKVEELKQNEHEEVRRAPTIHMTRKALRTGLL